MLQPLFKNVLCGFIIGSAAIVTPAQADVIYTYTGLPTYVNANGNPSLGTTVQIDLSDARVASGNFTLQAYGIPTATFTGDASGFINFHASGANITPGLRSFSSFDITVIFDATGDIISDHIRYLGTSDDGILSGTEALTTGAIGSDNGRCNADANANICTVSGSWTHTLFAAPIPEPGTLALLCAGLIGVGLTRRSSNGPTR